MESLLPSVSLNTINMLTFSDIYTTNLEDFFFSDIRYNDNLVLIPIDELKINNVLLDDLEVYYLYCEIPNDNIYNFFLELEKKILNVIKIKGKNWFGENIIDNIKDMFRSNLLLPMQINGLPRIKIRIPVKDGNILSKFFNANGKQIPINELAKNDLISLIISINTLNFYPSSFTLDQSVYQIRKMDNSSELRLVSDSESDNDIILSDN